MANYLVSDAQLTGIANAIRAKSGGTSPLAFPNGFTSEVSGLITLDDIETVREYRTKTSVEDFGTQSNPTYVSPGQTLSLYTATFDVVDGMIFPKLQSNFDKVFSAEKTITGLSRSGTFQQGIDITHYQHNSTDQIWVTVFMKNTGTATGRIWGEATIKVDFRFYNVILTESSDEEEIPVTDETIIP